MFGKNKLSADRGGVIVCGDNAGVVNTGVIHGDVVLHQGAELPLLALQIPFTDAPEATVPGLLSWRSRLPAQLVGRAQELADLQRWAAEPARRRVRIVHGGGGTGKTRLAFELALTLREQGWEAGQLADPGRSQAFRQGRRGTLLIIDYPEQYAEAVRALLTRLRDSQAPQVPLRVLLLCREAEPMATIVSGAMASEHSPPLALDPLAAPAWPLFCAGWAAFAPRLGRAHTPPPLTEAAFAHWLARDATHGKALLVLAHALNLAHDPTATGLKRHQILSALVDREGARVEAECRASPELAAPATRRGARLLWALAAVPGGLDAAALHALASRLQAPGIALPPAVALHGTRLWAARAHTLAELQPDLLAANLLYRTLAELLPDPATRGAWLWHTLATGATSLAHWRQRLSRLARLSLDRPPAAHGPGPDPLLAALGTAVGQNLEWASTLLPAVEHNRLEPALAPLAAAATQAILARGGRDAAEEAGLLNNLSLHLAEAGERAAELQAIRRAVDIYEQLAQDNFAAYGPDLAGSLNNLSLHLAEAGERAAGLQAIRRAVAIREQLAQDNFAAYGPDLAMSLNNLSLHLAEAGERAAGLQAIRRAVDIREQLAQDNFAAYGPDLAMSLNNLSVHLAEAGERAAGLQAIRRAVDIYEQLAQDNFAAYGPDLASSLGNLAMRLWEDGQQQGAQETLARAIGMLRPFALPGSVYADWLAAMLRWQADWQGR